jgi:hypothetical protein
MGLLQLYVNIAEKTLVEGIASRTRVSLPPFFQGDTVSLEIAVLKRNPGGGYAAPFSKLTLSGYSCRVGLGLAPVGNTAVTPAALQTTFTISADNLFTGDLALNTAGINTMLGSSAQVSGVFEIELGIGGTYETIFQTTVTLKAELIESAATVPTPTETYLTASETEAQFVAKVMGNGEAIYIPNEAGDFATKLWTDSDGTFRADRLAWPL